ncbi:MAG TPA: MFS transporter [Steroidobacteraceae bacterium]|jgi:MFS family permease|nr:MFS transporter [Steroidobacteraceae bacterium]
MVSMRTPFGGRQRALIPIIFVTWGIVFLDRMAVLYLAPYIAPDLHLSSAQVGSLAGVIALCWAVSSLVFGAVSDRVGRRTVLVPMVVLFSLLSVVSGLARNFEQLLLVRALLGIAEGPCWSVMMALVEENSSAQHRGRNVGVVVSAAAIIGLAIAPVLTTQVAAHFGWRWAFFIAGAPGLVMAVLIALVVREPSAEAQAAHRIGLRELLSLLRYRNIWVAAMGAAGFMTWLFLVNAFAPLYITTVEHQAGTVAGFLMGAAGLGSFFIGLLAPALSDRFGRRAVLAVLGVLCAILPLALLMQPLYAHLWWLAAILFVTQGGQAVSAICIVLVPTESVPRNLVASAIGFTTMFGEMIGGFAAPIVAGALAAKHGLGEPLWVAAAGAMVVFVVALALRPVAIARTAASFG